MSDRVLKYFRGDRYIWWIIISLSLVSLLAVFSAAGTLAYKVRGGNVFYYLLRHGAFLAAGFGITYFIHLINYKIYLRLARLFLIITIPLLFVTLVTGTNLNDASRWIRIPIIGLTFQTSDLAKFSLIIFVARYLSQNQDKIRDFKLGLRKILIIIIVVCILIFPANFSTSALLFFNSTILLIFGRAKVWHIFAVYLTAATLFILLIVLSPHISFLGRLQTWKNRIENYIGGDNSKKSKDKIDDDGFQVTQAKIAIATGGIMGRGPGNSIQRNSLPHPYSDFIFAIIIEEYGIFGGIVLIFIYLALLYRAYLIVINAKSQFAAFLAIGLTFNLVFQALINMGVAVNILPVTGQTLPLVSMGGTSVFFTSATFGVILNVSRSSIKNKKEIKKTNNNKTIEKDLKIEKNEDII